MTNAYFHIPQPKNEPCRAYLPGSIEKAALKAELKKQSEQRITTVSYTHLDVYKRQGETGKIQQAAEIKKTV